VIKAFSGEIHERKKYSFKKGDKKTGLLPGFGGKLYLITTLLVKWLVSKS
jgi:hypothetical protein